MRNQFKYFSPLLFLLLGLNSPVLSQTDNHLWYNKPAEKWTEALPIGNGRMGAMIYGGVQEDHLQFNESSFWTGMPREYARKGASDYLGSIRKALLDGKQKQALPLSKVMVSPRLLLLPTAIRLMEQTALELSECHFLARKLKSSMTTKSK